MLLTGDVRAAATWRALHARAASPPRVHRIQAGDVVGAGPRGARRVPADDRLPWRRGTTSQSVTWPRRPRGWH